MKRRRHLPPLPDPLPQGERTGRCALPSVTLRREATAADVDAVRGLVRATGFFSAEEVNVAVELVQARLDRGAASGYHFLFAERAGQVIGYACYGPVPLTRSGYDLYWIVVHPRAQGGGAGRLLLAETEAAVAAFGGTALYAETSSRPQYAPTRAFYRRAGYREAARLKDFYAPGDGKLVFEKRLTPRSNGPSGAVVGIAHLGQDLIAHVDSAGQGGRAGRPVGRRRTHER